MTFMAPAWRTYAAIGALCAVAALVISLTRNSYYQLMLTMLPIWAVMGLSWNVLSGYSGAVSFGHGAFLGLGAYTVALLFVKAGITPWLGVPAAAIVGMLAALLIGSVTFRLRGPYFSLAMLAYPLALLYVFEWAGFQEVSLPMKRENPAAYMQFVDQRWNAAVAFGLLAIALVVTLWVERSRFGLSLLAIKQNELAAEAAGIDSRTWKLRAIAVSGALGGAAGGLYAVSLLVVTPESVFGMAASAEALIVAMFGGVGTLWGPVLGASVLIPLSETLQANFGSKLPGIQGVVFGLAIIVVTRLMPQGMYWSLRDWMHGRRTHAVAQLPLAAGTLGAGAERRLGEPEAANGSPALLEVSAVSRTFGGLMALGGVDIVVRAHEILGIIGPNGAGKTTLFNVLNGVFPPSSGRIRFGTHDIAGLRPSQVCALGIGRTFQVVRSFSRMTLLENVAVGAFVGSRSDVGAVSAAKAALEQVGLAHLAGTPAGGLTNYQLRLMELARALAAHPTLALLDEPFAGLASEEIETFLDLIKRLRSEGLTIVIIEHTMHVMVKLVDRFVVLDHGSVIADGAPQEVIRDSAVIKAYLGEKWVQHALP
jgi:ABC-type branched-subunit amino acid transport system ATPase component/ABC-type branched-subunit amino acid transport system permease subunit